MLDLILQTPGCLPPLVWGGPGVGKSQRIGQLFRNLDLPLETVIASIREPQDFAGLPIPEPGDGVKLEPPSWAKRLAKEGKGGAFIDEISCTPPATQAALLRVVHEGVVGDLILPKAVKMIAAANPPDQAAGGWDLSLPLANRFVHLVWHAPSATEWNNWLLGSPSNEGFTRLDIELWEKKFNRAKTLVAGFMRKFPDALSENPDKIAGRFPMAYSTPRTWECATRLYATILATGRDDAMIALLAGAVGEPNATRFLTWVREADLPDPEDLLKDPNSWDPDPNRPDATYAVLNSVAFAATEKNPPPIYAKRWKAAFVVMSKAMGHGKDLIVVSARRLLQKDARPKDGLSDAVVIKVLKELKDVVRDAGLME